MTQSLVSGCTYSPPAAKANSNAQNSTLWHVAPSAGLDACFALTIAAADPSILQVHAHQARREHYRDLLGPEGVAAAERLMRVIAASGRGATAGPALALVASAGKLNSVDDVVHSFSTEGLILGGFQGTSEFQGERGRANLERLRPIAAAAFEALAKSGFENDWRTNDFPKLDASASSLARELADVDMLAEHRRYLSRPFSTDVTVFVSELSEPHGMRIVGQRFVASPNYSTKIVRRVAAHEIIHRLLDDNRPETARIVERLGSEPLLKNIAANADPAFGYTSRGAASTRGLVEEGGVQALEAIINERLGQGRDQGEYWRTQDDGMHIFAAGTYALMRQTGFARRGGDMLEWLDQQTAAGNLQGEALQAHSASIVGRPAVQRWIDV